MDCLDHRGFKHTTLDAYPAKVAGITLRDESPGLTGVYVRDAAGGLYPARTVSHTPPAHHAQVIAAWLAGAGEHRDECTKVGV